MTKPQPTTRFANRRVFICMRKDDIRGFRFQSDRDYFSKPVEVKLSHSNVLTRAMYVTDTVRGHTYPVCIASLKTIYELTRKQKEVIHDGNP